MAKNWALLDKQAIGHVRRNAIREIVILSRAGEFIDTARVMGRWRHTEHSRETRRHINALIQDGYLKVGYSECPVHRFLESIKESVHREMAGASTVSRSDLGVLAAEEQARADTAAWDAEESLDKAIASVKKDVEQVTPDDNEEFLDYSGLAAFAGATG